ncbi:hypothetical protein C8Q80DRAFT_1274523 [Daedaleopsis nitida]|nr:hypothetical protein C8Q80DRAFT_1274523 [Daedaleopsis nitida]
MLAFSVSFFALALGAVSAFALPATDTTSMKRADLGPWCNGLGIGAIGDQADFKLTAYNTTGGPNVNATGAPLVLAPSPSYPNGLSVYALSTYATYPHDDYPTMSIVNGRLFPKGRYPAAGAGVATGEEVEFVAGPFTRAAYYPQQYCVVAETSSHAQSHENLLAVNGDVAGFSLCALGSQYHVVYKPTSGKKYDLQSCYSIFLQVIRAE